MRTPSERITIQDQKFFNPEKDSQSDFDAVYRKGIIEVGLPHGSRRLYEGIARDNTAVIIGIALGDEGKGRIVDNKLEALLSIPGIQLAYVDRFQGGSNSGHTVEKDDVKLALHQVPSGVLHPEVIGIMDRGMVIHPGDLQAEVAMIEGNVGDTRGKLVLSRDAILLTDLERAEEVLNRIKAGKAKGGTGRGIAPAYAHFYDRLGLSIHDLVEDGWREKLGAQYDRYAKEFALYDISLSSVEVPDYQKHVETKKEEKRPVGSKEEFLDRLEAARTWLIDRDMVKNTHIIHLDAYQDPSKAMLFEGAQAIGLHPWLGTYPDITVSDASAFGIQTGTGVWRAQDIRDRIGVFKITYTSSVGARHMPTEVPLPKDLRDLPEDAGEDEIWAAHVREDAHEYGTTTGRPRDILFLDLPMMTYNCRMSGIEVLAGTHLDIAHEGESIKVCTHYTNEKGDVVPYQSGLQYQEHVTPHYITLPGWDGEATRQASSCEELPENAQKFLAFIQRRTGYPIVAATTGPDRKNLVTFPGYSASS